nr:antitoxin Xre-like helix-turn-helix domain-containing protein [uncultured Pseudomonas sp.]
MSHVAAVPVIASKDVGAIALRTAITIMEKWQASAKQIESVLRISRSTYARAKDQQRAVSLDSDQIARVSLVLNIHAALRTVFDNPDNVYGFVAMKNHNAFFAGQSPLAVMAQGSFIQLYETFRRIDVLRGAQW